MLVCEGMSLQLHGLVWHPCGGFCLCGADLQGCVIGDKLTVFGQVDTDLYYCFKWVTSCVLNSEHCIHSCQMSPRLQTAPSPACTYCCSAEVQRFSVPR
jgi:hypothetical protein